MDNRIKKSINYGLKRINVLTAILFFGCTFGAKGALDIFIVDTYYVTPISWIFIILGIFYLFFASVQWKLERTIQPLSKWIIWSHYSITTASILYVTFSESAIYSNSVVVLALGIQVVYGIAILFSIFRIVWSAFTSDRS